MGHVEPFAARLHRSSLNVPSEQKRVAGERVGSRVLQSENLTCNVLLAEFTALPSVP
jgi:hypothetical protein